MLSGRLSCEKAGIMGAMEPQALSNRAADTAANDKVVRLKNMVTLLINWFGHSDLAIVENC